MYNLKSAIRIALLENTGVSEEEIKDVVAAVIDLTTEHKDPCCWIVEHPERVPYLTRFKEVAEHALTTGHIVTPHVSVLT